MTHAKHKYHCTPAMKRALRALYEAGSGVMTPKGGVLAAGEMLPFAPITYLRLVGLGFLELQHRRLTVTASGIIEAVTLPAIKDGELDRG